MREKCVIVVVGSLPILDYLSEQVRIASEALGYVTYTIILIIVQSQSLLVTKTIFSVTIQQKN